MKPRVEKARADIAQDLPKYNVIPSVESVLGVPASSNKITIYLLYYSKPHGIEIRARAFLPTTLIPSASYYATRFTK